MNWLRSLRSRLIVASVLWTGGLLMLMHMLSLVMMHVLPGTRRIGVSLPVFVGLVLMVAGFGGLRNGLKPFRYLRERLGAVRSGTDRRVSGEYPTEVQPLIDDLNALLEDRERAVRRAIATAGDLAHGLKTPLAILLQEAEQLRASGNTELAESISQQAERMRRHVEYHLARARAAASGASPTARCPAAECAQGLVRTLGKLYAGRGLEFRVDISADLVMRVEREDFEEMLGNLLDNASKWGRARVLVAGSCHLGVALIAVEDDGPGIAAPLRTVVLQRGVRADEAAPGSGLGLAIVRDLAEAYGGSITLVDAAGGGLRAELRLPC